MAYNRYHKDRIGNHRLHPETLMLGYGYEPALSEGAVKAPVFLTSTFVFRSAEEGRDFFDYVSGRRKPPAGDEGGLVYSRFNHPNSEIVEDRLAIFEEAETAVVFSSGMSAIATTLLAYVRPGDVILHSQPLYGGTESLLAQTLHPLGVTSQGFARRRRRAAIRRAARLPMRQRARAHRPGRVALQSAEHAGRPRAGPPRRGGDRAAAERLRPLIVCDNTLLGPIFQKPLRHGIDIVIYSLTKYVGGHSDLVAGAALGSQAAAADPATARRDRHAARSAFVLDARPFARDTDAAHEPRPAATPRP